LSKWISARVAHFIREPALLQKRPCWRVCRCRSGRSRRHDRSGSKRHYAREEGDDVATVENHVRGRSALAHMAVDHVVIVSRRASEISSAVTIQGPKGPCVSKDLPSVTVGLLNCQSRTLRSFATT